MAPPHLWFPLHLAHCFEETEIDVQYVYFYFQDNKINNKRNKNVNYF